MTEPRRARRRRTAWPVVGASVALFLAIFVFLAAQIRAGRDPALMGAAASPAKRVVVKRVERRVVERVYDDDDGESQDGGGEYEDGYAGGGSVSSASAAPAPAPVTTRSS